MLWTSYRMMKNSLAEKINNHANQGLLNRWTSQLDLGITAGGLERAVSVHNST